MSASGKQWTFHRVTSPAKNVQLVEFNRPPVNAFNDAMWQELHRIIEETSGDPDVRVIVLASTLEKGFTAGLDLTAQDALAQSELDPARKALALRQHLLEFQAAITSLSTCRQPVIAALHGISLGLAIDLASACDIRLAASDAVFGIQEVNVGLAADIGTLQRFPKIVGNDSLARELAMTGRKFDATEAREIAFVSKVVPGGRAEVVAVAMRLAQELAGKSPVALISTKHLLNHARDHTVQEGLEYTAAWNAAMLQSQDTQVAMRATLGKTIPTFPPLPQIKAKL